MLFNKAVENIGTVTDLKRISSAYVIDYRNLTPDEIKTALIKTAPQYYFKENIEKSLRAVILHENRDIRIIAPIIIKEILLNKDDFTELAKTVDEEVIEYEKGIIDQSNEELLSKNSEKNKNIDLFKFVLETAWENNDDISPDEKNLIEKIKIRLRISDIEYQLIEAKMGKYPTPNNQLHIRDEILSVRRYLQSVGLLLSIRDSDNNDYDIIPDELAQSLRELYGTEMRRRGYQELINSKYVRNKKYIIHILEKNNIECHINQSVPDLQNLCIRYIKPTTLIGGYSPRDGLDVSDLYRWCQDLNLPVSGQKNELIKRIICYYDGIQQKVKETEDAREIWFNYFEDFASRNLGFLRQQGAIEKDLDCERQFEQTTNYLFEKLLRQKPLILKGTEHPDGILSFQDKLVYWDNKSKETPVNLSDHIKQFDRYISNSEKPVAIFLVIGADFTDESVKECLKYSSTHDTVLTLVKAKDLKKLALEWKQSTDNDASFPLGYFKQTGLLDTSLIDIKSI